MPPPHFLLLDDRAAAIQEFVSLVKRIGLANPVAPCGTAQQAKGYLTASPAALPVVVFSRDKLADDLTRFQDWMRAQGAPVATIPVVRLQDPLVMSDVIGALKALRLPERARIDATALTVRVELWPHGTVIDDA